MSETQKLKDLKNQPNKKDYKKYKSKNEYKEDQKKDVLRLALFIGEAMLTNGAETSRVEDTIIRICKSRGFRHINVFTSPTTLIIADERFDGLTFMKSIKSRSINLNKIVLYNDFSRKFVEDTSISPSEGIKELKKINKEAYSYPTILYYLATGFACASFALLLGGTTLPNFIATVIVSMLGFAISENIDNSSSISAFGVLLASIVIAGGGIVLSSLSVIDSPTTLIVGSIMPLLPGVSFVKGARDLICGDLISGVARIFDAGLTAISIACGTGIMLNLWLKLGGM
jgi:uncharacterized membrane protein YjjP (DUF1212 family)